MHAFLSTLSLRRATAAPPAPQGESSISIHALLAESDLFRQNYECFQWIFLSTLSLRRATYLAFSHRTINIHFYPRSPCGERLPGCFFFLCCIIISIHALLAESDTELFAACTASASISIHALLAESDTWARGSRVTYVEFLSTLSLRRATQE